MDKLTRQFFGDAKKVRLHPAEKSQVWDQISMRASSKPVLLSDFEKAEGFDRIADHMRRNPLSVRRHTLQHFFALHRVAAMAMCAVLLIGAGGGGVAYAAEEAMPEDILYPVKLHFNEPLIGAFHRTPERRAAWEQQRLDRRLREAEHLSERPEFTEDRRAMLEERIEQRVNSFQEHVERLPEQKREEFEQRLQERFDRHQEFLQKLEDGTATKQEVRRFKESIQHIRPPKPQKQHAPRIDNIAQPSPQRPELLEKQRPNDRLMQQRPPDIMRRDGNSQLRQPPQKLPPRR